MRSEIRKVASIFTIAVLPLGCSQKVAVPPTVPALQYSETLHQQMAQQDRAYRPKPSYGPNFQQDSEPRAQLRFASDELPPELSGRQPELPVVSDASESGDYTEYRSSEPEVRDYSGPLSLGDPGVSASLWQEGRGGNDMFRDDRAWQPMDLLTITVSESSQGSKEADTEVKSKSSLTAAVSALLGFQKEAKAANPNLDPTSLIDA